MFGTPCCLPAGTGSVHSWFRDLHECQWLKSVLHYDFLIVYLSPGLTCRSPLSLDSWRRTKLVVSCCSTEVSGASGDFNKMSCTLEGDDTGCGKPSGHLEWQWRWKSTACTFLCKCLLSKFCNFCTSA